MTPLSILQKREIAIAARRAYDVWTEREAFELINPELSRTACFEAWRHVEQGKAAGVQSLRAATQAHYGRLLAHFQELGGDPVAAARTATRDAENDKRIARYKLDEALRERGLATEYASSICRRQYRRTLAEASAKQLWCLVFTVRNRKKPAAKVPSENPF